MIIGTTKRDTKRSKKSLVFPMVSRPNVITKHFTKMDKVEYVVVHCSGSQTLIKNILFAEQPGRCKNRHQYPKENQYQSESEWRLIARLRSRHRPTDIGHSYSNNYNQYADTKPYPVLIHGNPSNLK